MVRELLVAARCVVCVISVSAWCASGAAVKASCTSVRTSAYVLVQLRVERRLDACRVRRADSAVQERRSPYRSIVVSCRTVLCCVLVTVAAMSLLGACVCVVQRQCQATNGGSSETIGRAERSKVNVLLPTLHITHAILEQARGVFNPTQH